MYLTHVTVTRRGAILRSFVTTLQGTTDLAQPDAVNHDDLERCTRCNGGGYTCMVGWRGINPCPECEGKGYRL